MINSLETECMDLETEPPQEWKKDENSINDTLNESENEKIGNISKEVEDFATIDSSVKGPFI